MISRVIRLSFLAAFQYLLCQACLGFSIVDHLGLSFSLLLVNDIFGKFVLCASS